LANGRFDAVLLHAIGADEYGHSLAHQTDQPGLMFPVLLTILLGCDQYGALIEKDYFG
jgi:hypothetical protein